MNFLYNFIKQLTRENKMNIQKQTIVKYLWNVRG